MRNKMSRNAIKQAFDNLPSGICFFNKNGVPVLCNRQMHRLIHMLTGRDLQLLSDITAILNHEESTAENIQLLSDKTVWQFRKSAISADGNQYIQYVATDVTDIYNRKKDLEESTAKYDEMIKDMKQITDNVVAITREEEILTMKMRIHGNVGIALQRLKRFSSLENTETDKTELADELKKVTAMLKNELGNDDEIDAFDELNRVSRNIGANIIIDGTPPECETPRVLLAQAIRECLTNTMRHADGNTVYVALQYDENTVTAVITNDGKNPTEEIVEGGGLSALRKRIEKCGGTMTIQSRPQFALRLTLNSGQ